MTSRFEPWNNLHRAMTALAHWYALIDNEVILELQNKVIHEVLYNRYCLIKWAPMHKQVTMPQKLLSHIFEQYADIQDDGYISDEDIEEYPETFMPRPCIMPMSLQGPAQLKQPEVAHIPTCHNTEQRLEQGLCQIRRQRTNLCRWTASALMMKVCTSQMTPRIGSMNHHQTGTCAFMMNTRTDVNILEHHPIQIP